MGSSGNTHNEDQPVEDLKENVDQEKILEKESDDDSEKTENIVPEKEENDKEGGSTNSPRRGVELICTHDRRRVSDEECRRRVS